MAELFKMFSTRRKNNLEHAAAVSSQQIDERTRQECHMTHIQQLTSDFNQILSIIALGRLEVDAPIAESPSKMRHRS